MTLSSVKYVMEHIWGIAATRQCNKDLAQENRCVMRFPYSCLLVFIRG